MKNFILIIVFLVAFHSKAQTPVVSLFDTEEYGDLAGAYYKDTYNDFNNFTGTWEYVNGPAVLKIVLQKKLQTYSTSGNFYRDMVVGGYQYIENGIEKVNTLNQLSDNSLEVYEYSIVGNTINVASNVPLCAECPPEQKRLLLDFKDPTRTADINLYGEIILRRVDSGGVQKIELWLRQRGNIIYIDGTPPPYTSFNVPWGKYVLTKVE
jgi:hypothetical protein